MALELVRAQIAQYSFVEVSNRESPDSAAALFQSWAHGAFVPAGGPFATLTSLGMTGGLAGIAALYATPVATVVAVIVWMAGVGH